ncbi:MAG: hypothetical protein SGI77_18860 [Pirellulaceae bacterium]|nr:hypothetical protein [Pirellulaceae bacterium]
MSLQNAFTQASRLPEQEQDLLASRLLAELAADTEFDRAITASSEKLAQRARDALDDHRRRRTTELKFDAE